MRLPRAPKPLRTLPCGTCGFPVDPLRAARVAIFGERFHYFCSPGCRSRFAPPLGSSLEARRGPEVSPVESSERSREEHSTSDVAGSSLPPSPAASERRPSSWTEPAPSMTSSVGVSAERGSAPPSTVPAASVRPSVSASREAPQAALSVSLPVEVAPGGAPRSRALLSSALLGAGAGLADGIHPTGLAAIPEWLAPTLALLASAALSGAWLVERSAERGRTKLLGLAPAGLASLGLFTALALDPRELATSAGVAGTVCLASALSGLLCARRERELAPSRAALQRALGAEPAADALTDDRNWAERLKAGEEIGLEPEDRAPADVVIVRGHAVVQPWFGAEQSVPRQEGEVLLAGGRLLEGSVRAVVRWAGMDRAWARLTVDPQRRADRQSQLARVAERVTSSGALSFAGVGAMAALWGHVPRVLTLSAAAATAAAFASSGLEELMALHIARGVLRLLAHGISFRSPGAFDRTARVSGALFCAEGTLLRGELGVTSVEVTGQLRPEELVSLLAGAHAGTSSPLASALQRSAQERRVRADAARSRSYTAGLGVTAITSTGQSLVAGTRSLLLERRISVANAEPRIAEIEAAGQSALLVALDGRWVGLLALQDGFAEGARAAVERTIDAGVEPIFMSSETRDTCQALARQLGVEHVRPEVLPRDRAEEVRRVSQLRGSIAVVGRSSNDDAALGAAALSINLDPRGGPIERWDVDVASGAVEDATLALQLATWLHTRGRRALQFTALPAAFALLSLAVGAPLQLLPLWGTVASLLIARQLRTPPPQGRHARD